MDHTNMSFEEVSEKVGSLLSINSENLDTEALNNQKIFVEINRIYVQFSRKLVSLVNQQNKVEHKRYRYYAGKATKEEYKAEPLNEAVLKTDIKHYMDIDEVVIEIRKLVKECELIVKFLEDSKSQLRSRGYDIKNAIEWRKLMMGA